MIKELRPIKISTEEFESVEKRIIELLRKEIYAPLIAELGYPKKTLTNSTDDLLEAIRSGRITFYRGTFSGRFNASVSKELKRLGAEWDRRQRTFKIPQSSLPIEIKNAISASEARFTEKIAGIEKKLAQMLPEEIADKLEVERYFDTTLWKTQKDFESSVKGITVAPQLSPAQRKKIASEWQNNMKLWVKDWTEKEIKSLRKDVQKSVFTGNRYEATIKTIQTSYGQSQNKAKFLARQETNLLMTKFKESRYTDAGVMEYKWGCVAGSKNHPVRPMHKALEGKIFRWDNPPITDEKGHRNNPGQDYNCRCFARPVVRLK